MERSTIRDASGHALSTHIVAHGMTSFPQILNAVLNPAHLTGHRGYPAMGAGQVTLVLTDPTQGLAPTLASREAAVYALQLIGSYADIELQLWAGARSFLSHGHKIGSQIEYVLLRLARSGDGNATIYLGSGELQIKLVFANHWDRLNLNVTTNGCDALNDLPYLVFQLTQLQICVARALDIGVGAYTQTSYPMYVKHADLPEVEDLLLAEKRTPAVAQPHGVGTSGQTWNQIQTVARAIAHQLPSWDNFRMTDDELWYADQLADYTKD